MDPMGIYDVVVVAVSNLWESMGLLWLRCGTYGIDLWTQWVSMVLLWLRCIIVLECYIVL